MQLRPKQISRANRRGFSVTDQPGETTLLDFQGHRLAVNKRDRAGSDETDKATRFTVRQAQPTWSALYSAWQRVKGTKPGAWLPP